MGGQQVRTCGSSRAADILDRKTLLLASQQRCVAIGCSLDQVAAGHTWNDGAGMFLLWGMNVTSQEEACVIAPQ